MSGCTRACTYVSMHGWRRQCHRWELSIAFMLSVLLSCSQYYFHALSITFMLSVLLSCSQYYFHALSITFMLSVLLSCSQYYFHALSITFMLSVLLSCSQYYFHAGVLLEIKYRYAAVILGEMSPVFVMHSLLLLHVFVRLPMTYTVLNGCLVECSIIKFLFISDCMYLALLQCCVVNAGCFAFPFSHFLLSL